MANAIDNNVIYIDTTGYTNTQPLKIESIRYIGAASSSAVITSGGGVRLFESALATNETAEVCINAQNGISVALTGTAKIYIYLK